MSKVSNSSRLPLPVATVTLKSSMVYRRLGEANLGVWGTTPLIRVTLTADAAYPWLRSTLSALACSSAFSLAF